MHRLLTVVNQERGGTIPASISPSLRSVFDAVLTGPDENLRILKDRGLIDASLTGEDLDDGDMKAMVIDSALYRFRLRQEDERLSILRELEADARTDTRIDLDALISGNRSSDPTLALLDQRAAEIWQRTTDPIRERAREIIESANAVKAALGQGQERDLDAFIKDARAQITQLEARYRDSVGSARRELRSEYVQEFGKTWNDDVARHYDAVVTRSVFRHPTEYIEADKVVTALDHDRRMTAGFASQLDRPNPTRTPRPSPKPR